MHHAIDRTAAQLADLAKPLRCLDPVRGRVHEDRFADVHDARLLESRRHLVDTLIRAVQQQPAQAVLPAPAVRNA
ncbi:hypothetical protein R52603_05749 [Paraburkholderia saeva]|uniref:Uncharacterized protein n=1 Tax=Paraburkholderia saeva TaxID=2777537 RepID=A0A9N8S2F7_9BURK|nr:hypothetical protein LMG31841_05824 [Paraburkholderia saeva]CAG4928740.1 hypothetical protein R70241_05772 [Paraburkholderia saeva]CAG4928819.1 hypothetical protein R52603_05749 [Paraburkholderia saeva]